MRRASPKQAILLFVIGGMIVLAATARAYYPDAVPVYSVDEFIVPATKTKSKAASAKTAGPVALPPAPVTVRTPPRPEPLAPINEADAIREAVRMLAKGRMTQLPIAPPTENTRSDGNTSDASLSPVVNLSLTLEPESKIESRPVLGLVEIATPEVKPSEPIPVKPATIVPESMPPVVVALPPKLELGISGSSGEEEQSVPPKPFRVAPGIAVMSFVQGPEPVTPAPAMLPAALPPAAVEAPACSTCGRGLEMRRRMHTAGESLYGGCSHCGSGWNCSPGRQPCPPCESDTAVGRFFCDFYECMCCQDPCYEPTWLPLASAAIFVDAARPMTQQEIRWNAGLGGMFPDRSEYFWARADGQGKGPRPPTGRRAESGFRFNDLVLITETAKDKLSAIVEFPYRSVDPETYNRASGLGDMGIGTKTLLVDCELLLVAFQFKTYLPMGNVLKGVGNGHISLEPSLLFSVKMSQDTYIQGQISEWIPLGGDPSYAGSILHTHFSYNHLLCHLSKVAPLVGTIEINTWSFQDGQYSDPIQGPFQPSSDTTYVSMGPGIRLFICDKIDFGFGAAFSLTGENFAREYYRTSFRWRF